MNSPKLAYSFGGVLLTGAVTSGLLTKDNRWMHWHFSRLGEGGTFASVIFNMTLIISAFLMLNLALTIRDNISNIPSGIMSESAADRAGSMFFRAFCYVTVCLIGVALFPFDRFPAIHNVFGYSMLFTFLYLCAATSRILPIFSKKFYIYGYSILLLTIILYTFFLGFKSVTLLFVEMIILAFLYGWLLMFIDGITKASKRN